MDKVPAEHAFLDLSDYARPLARWLAEHVPSFVTPIHLTLSFLFVGLAAAVLFAQDRYLPWAGALLLFKSLLDAADGSLARVRQKPSRVGRFLDSVCDVFVTIAVFSGIAFAEWRSHPADGSVWLLAAVAALSATLQGSVYSFYYVSYRGQTGGDPTSQVRETAQGYAGDNPLVLAVLYGLYRLIYSWQDHLMAWLDQSLAPNTPVSPWFLTAASVLGLGTQLLMVAFCAAFNQPILSLFLFAIPFNLYGLGLFFVRYATRLSTKP